MQSLGLRKPSKTMGSGFLRGPKKTRCAEGGTWCFQHCWPQLHSCSSPRCSRELAVLTARRPLEPSGTAEKHQEAGFGAFFSSTGLLNAIQSKDQIHTGESSL